MGAKMIEPASTTRLVKKVVIGYKLPALPTFLMRSFILLRSKLARVGFRVEVILSPLDQLPSDIDLLFVPTELIEAASQAAPGARVIPLTASTAQQPAYDDLLKQLKTGQTFYALRVEDEEKQLRPENRMIVRYRGYRRLL
jgi:hypothetical protein